MHVTASCDLLGTDDRHVIFGLAGYDTGVAADAGRGVDHHAPGIGIRGHGGVKRRQQTIRRIWLGRFCEIFQRPDGIEIARVPLQPDMVLSDQDLTPLRGGSRATPSMVHSASDVRRR